jgi:hypothetical protein
MNESLRCTGRWSNTTQKQVDCGGREGTELIKILAILNTAFTVIAVDGKISLELLSGCDCRGFFKNASIFN